MPLCFLSMIDDENDRICFERLYQKYEKDVFHRICRFLKNREDAEDAMQNTWLVITKNIGFYRGLSDDSIRAYILRIARNQAISVYRTRKRESILFCELDASVPSDDDNALIRACEENEIEAIVRCIDALDEKYSDVLNLFYLHHHSAGEIALLLGLNENTVRSRIARGKEKLTALLRRELHE